MKVSFAADDTGGAAEAAAKASDVAIVVVGNDPTCGPNMANDWTDDGTSPAPIRATAAKGATALRSRWRRNCSSGR